MEALPHAPKAQQQRVGSANSGVGGGRPRLTKYDDKKQTTIPRLGYLLRALIKAGGYRGYLIERGLDKNLDDLAVEAKHAAAA